jgi:membrane associated rhomboid family serine protease
MISNVTLNYSEFFALAKAELPFMGKLLLGLWAFNLINWLCKSKLNELGIYPRSASGLLGIIFSPFLHGDFNHLFFNTIPLFVLGMFILALGQSEFIAVSVLIALLEGILVWLFGRKYLHIGASGVISGYFGFVLGLAYFYPTIISLVLAFVAIYYFGSIIAGIIPTSSLISWECHLAGLLAGLAVMYAMVFVPGFERWAVAWF